MNKTFLKLAVGLIAVFAVVNVAGANTIADLQAMIAQLQAQIASLQGVATTPAVSATITSDLTIGSRGAQVEALQQMLIDGGYLKIAAPTGYFGSLTKAAVQAWQRDNGVSATGYFGPISRSKLVTIIVPPVVTPTDPTTPTTPTTPTLGNTDGSVTVLLDSYVGNQTLKKGETKDIYALKAQASVGNVAITRFDVRMSVRPWLYFNKLTLKDSSGNVIAEKMISSSADATELTVGSSYLVRFDNINYIVQPGSDKILVVSASVLPTTDKLTSDVSVNVKIGSNGIRTLNGKGYSESLTEDTGRTVTLSSTSSNGNIVARVNSNAPMARIQNVTTSGETTGVVLAVYDFKAENQNSTINTLKFALNSPLNQQAFSTIFKRVYLDDGSRTWNADSVASTTQFSNLTIDMAKDQWRTLTLKADVADADDFTNGSMASTSMAVSTTNIVGIDANYNTVTTGSNTIASSDVTFLQSGASLSNLSATYANVDNGTSPVSTSTVRFALTLNNTGSSDLFISKNPALFVATSTTAVGGRLTSLTSAATLSSDSATYFVIPSGASRPFVLEGDYGNDTGTSGSVEFKITAVNFADDTTNLQEFTINYGLEALRVYNYLNS